METILRIKYVYGRPCYIAQEDLESNRIQIPLRFPDGRKWSSSNRKLKSGESVTILRDNIAKT